MSVSLEKGPMPAPEGQQPSVDYDAMYKEAHPDAVDDVKKAELMATAMDNDEMSRKYSSERALQYAAEDLPDHEIQGEIDEAEYKRAQADIKAKKVSDIYDRMEDLRS